MTELEELFLYIDERSRVAARAVVARIEDACERLEYFPFVGEEASEPGTRTLEIVRFPYMLYYYVDDDCGGRHPPHPSHRT